jgi:Family of unknown function (DUF5686)/CarboxypepD_reg-like domain
MIRRILVILFTGYLLILSSLQLYAQKADTLFTHADSVHAPIIDTNASKVVVDTTKPSTSPVTTSKGGHYEITGIIRDKNNGEGIPFSTVFIPKSPIGTPTDLDGKFTLSFDNPPNDTIRIQALGYNTYNRILDRSKHQTTYYIDLERSAASLTEVVIHAGEDPALVLLKKIIKHKSDNNPDKLDNYTYEAYNKMEADLDNLTKEQFEKIPFAKNFSFIYNNVDSVSESVPYLPFYLIETLSDYYYQTNPKKTREFIKANILKGFKNETITQYLGSLYQNVNIYNNFIPIFDKRFVSPISNAGALYYRYKIKDTQVVYGHNVILVQFSPKRPTENCFYGDFWVVDTSYAIQRASLEISKDANIDWVKRVSIYQEYKPLNDSMWFYCKDKFIADFTLPFSAKLPGFIGRKTTTYKNVRVNDTSISNVINNPEVKTDVTVADSARHASDEYWAQARHDTLSKNEKAIYAMVDTLNKMPLFISYKNTIKFIFTGIKEFGPIEIGPYWNMFSRNPIEGDRFRITVGTTPQLFKNLYLKTYLAYGTKDEEFKYSASAYWLIKRLPDPRVYLNLVYTHDIDRSSNYYEQGTADNIFNLAARKHNVPFKLAFCDEARLEFYKEYYSGFSHLLTLQHKEFKPFAPLPADGIFFDSKGNPSNKIVNTETSIRFRYAYKEKYVENRYRRISLGSRYPITELRIGVGIKGVMNDNYDYQRVSLRVFNTVKIPPLGSLQYNIFAGKYFGTLPYPLLEIHPGNEFYYYNKFAFEMMNRYEFISDQYVGVHLEHDIGGGIFNYIPLLHKLKFRQFWTAKAIVGSVSDANRTLNFDKGYIFRSLEGNPYVELGTGVTNIFQFFRIDFVWRVTPKPLPTENKDRYFGIFGSVQIQF